MIPIGWKPKLFRDVADYKTGRTPARANSGYWEEADAGVPWVAISDMVEFGTVTHTKEKISQAAFDQVFRGQAVRAGTLIMSFKLTIGRVATLGIDACHNEAIISIYPKPGVDQRFLGYFLGQIDYESLQDRQVKGNTLNQDKIDRIEVPLPSEEEQTAIADVLDFVRLAIDIQDHALANAQDLKRVTMRTLFACGLKSEPREETRLGPLPHSWDVVDFVSVRDWLQYGTSTRCTVEPTEFPVLRIPNIEPGHVNATDLKFAALSTEDADRYLLEDGDLLFIRTNGVVERLGTCAVYAGEPHGALFASYLIRARLKRDRINPYFAAHFFSSEIGTRIIAGRATPAADGKYNLNTGTIDNLPIPLPPTLDEQDEIVAVLDAIDRKIDVHRRKRAVLNDLFKTLLHKLMVGKVRATNLGLSALKPTKAAGATV